LGQAILVEHDQGWQVLATEGGHVDFAPTDRMQLRLLEHLFERFGYYVCYERLLSGEGLVTIYNFLRDYRQIDENPELRIAMVNDDAAAAISDFAAQQQDPLAVEALDMFFAIYGAQAGNLALSVLSNQGLYIAGGIAGKNIDKFSDGTFMQAFLAKGRMRAVLEKIPVRVILQPEIGLTGARLLAQKAMYN
jgi:glucokinase